MANTYCRFAKKTLEKGICRLAGEIERGDDERMRRTSHNERKERDTSVRPKVSRTMKSCVLRNGSYDYERLEELDEGSFECKWKVVNKNSSDIVANSIALLERLLESKRYEGSLRP
ncbi:hypothetical protein Sjap_020125 [Stephania japonica]|uniref:Uncharacterized protein n=1 Tax=Stephania japonica TaxID=461633 RepID=A0AAP0I001_9MAGN